MSNLIIYYSFGGTTRKWAKNQEDCDLIEIKEKRKRNIITAFIPGCIQAIKRRTVEIEPLEIDYSKYEKTILAFPVWASNLAPSFNTVIDMLPKDKKIDIVAISGSGQSNKTETLEFVENKGFHIESYTDIKSEKV